MRAREFFRPGALLHRAGGGEPAGPAGREEGDEEGEFAE